MLNRRLINLFPWVKRTAAKSVFLEWLALLFSTAATVCICLFLDGCRSLNLTLRYAAAIVTAIAAAVVFRTIFLNLSQRNSALLAERVKKDLRERIFDKLSRLGMSYQGSVSTAETVQVSVEGTDQLEAYFAQYMPQLFYSLAATVTIFVFLLFVSPRSAWVLLICVPLIPLSIIAIQTLAKKLLSKYWDSYTDMGDSFLENIQGLTTLKIYRADAAKHEEMNRNAEAFRRATMRVLIMQLNSTSVMDIVACCGAAAGIIAAAASLADGSITFFRAMITVLLSAEFFIPLRRLGSYFHVSMNGAAAADKIFKILDTPEPPDGTEDAPTEYDMEITDMSFAYNSERTVLENISIKTADTGLYSLVGVSGSGKSTAAAILTGRRRGYRGSIRLGGTELSELSRGALTRTITLVTHDSHIFKGSVRYNLALADADEAKMVSALKAVRLWDFVAENGGLEMPLAENGANLSGGQRQRLSIARAILTDAPMYIFDEASSNIDSESEKAINEVIKTLSETRLVIMISHRLKNSEESDMIFVLKDGKIVERGTHAALTAERGYYYGLCRAQEALAAGLDGGDAA